jgi:NADH-quinone oxidoreductase subunit E
VIFEGSLAGDARRIVERYPAQHRRSAIMPLLYLAQSVRGMLDGEALAEIGQILGITTAEVEAVASFYTMYRLRPTGEHVINVCTNLACKLRGGQDVYEAAREAAGIPSEAEVSEDGMFTVHEEECLGLCDFAPAVQVNFAAHDNVTPERAGELIASIRRGEMPEPSRGQSFPSFRAASRLLAGLEELQEEPS